MAGIQILSTIHAADAPTTLLRLTDMGIDRFKLAAAAGAVLSLRLARRLCPDCKVKREASAEEVRLFHEAGVDLPAGATLFAPPQTGACASCRKLGFKGLLGLHELLLIDDGVRAALLGGASADTIRAAALNQGMRRLVQDGLEKVKLGLTTVAEVLNAISLV